MLDSSPPPRQIIPALGRLFCLIGVDLLAWYNDMPRLKRSRFWLPMLAPAAAAASTASADSAAATVPPPPIKRRTIDAYYQSLDCCVCGQPNAIPTASATTVPACAACLQDPSGAARALVVRGQFLEREQRRLWDACCKCAGTCSGPLTDECMALDCYLPFQKKDLAQLLAQNVWTLRRLMNHGGDLAST